MSDKNRKTVVESQKFDILNFEDDDMVQRSSILSIQENTDTKNDNNDFYKRKKLRQISDQLADSQDSQVQSSLMNQLKDLRIAIAELYLGIKQKTRDENEIISPEEEKEERDIIMSLDSYMIIEYIKSSVDIILNLKFEEIEKRLLDKTSGGPLPGEFKKKCKSQVNDGTGLDNDTQRSHALEESSQRSSISQCEGPPRIYEEVIQNLEADIRKHIRIEQQLKLHIESVENRVEELESQVAKLEQSIEKLQKESTKFKESEDDIKRLKDLIKQKEDIISKGEQQIKLLKDSEVMFKIDIEKLKNQLIEQSKQSIEPLVNPLQMIHQAIDNASRAQDLQQVMNQTQPMIMKPGQITITDKPLFIKQHPQHQNFESQSSNKSFEHDSPDRRTPDLTHPYLQTQLMQKKKTASGSQMNKKFINQTEFGLQASLNAMTSTYSGGQAGKVNQRRMSNQARSSKNGKSNTKSSWVGQYHGQTFSNIINNNIQGLSINYSNQIIQNNNDASLQQLAKSFIQSQNLLRNDSYDPPKEDSESSNLNSHRRCKSQNVKHDPNESASTHSVGKKSMDKRYYEHGRQIVQDISADELLALNDSLQKGQRTEGKVKRKVNEDISFDNNRKYDQNPLKDNTMVYDYLTDSNNKRRFVKPNASTGSAHNYTTQQIKTMSNRFISNNNNIDELSKLKFNQSFGGNQAAASLNGAVLQQRSTNFMNPHSISHSVEKNSRSRNKQQQNLMAAQTAALTSKFDSNIFDMHFKTTTSSANQQQQQSKGNKSGFLSSKQTNTSVQFINQPGTALLKQQLMNNKKASNLLMKGLSPLKKQ